MRLLNSLFAVCLLCFCSTSQLFAGTSPCASTTYPLSDFGTTKTYVLDNGTFTDLPDPSCGDYQGQDFWVRFTGPASGLVNIELLDGSITDAAFEVYRNACNGLATSNGCFADRNCGAIDMPGANLEVVPGETYHVRIYQEGGGGGTLGFRMSDLGGTNFNLAGSAIDFDSGNPLDNCVQLTSETNNQVGCAWFDTPIDFASGFEINYQLFFGDIDANGADGIAFVFHTDPSPPCSSAGGQLGVVGISNSFIVEFDTWRNGNFGDNLAEDHVAINLNGAINIPIAAPVPIGVNGNVEDGLWHDVTLRWDPVSNFFEVIFDNERKIGVDISLITTIFATGVPVYWGLTGTTGGAFNNQRFCFQGFEVENSNSVESNIDAKICDGAPYIFNGSVLFDAGEYVEVFDAANGCDSTVTLTLEIVEIEIMGMEEIVLPCANDGGVTDIQLSATVVTNEDENTLSYSWSTDDGIIDSGENTLNPTVSSEGTYTLTVESSSPNRCEEEFVVTVSTAVPPEVTAQGGFIGCGGNGEPDSLILSCNTGEGGLLVEWTTLNGNIIGDPNVPNPVVDSIGEYTVTVTDPVTGCSASSTTSVGGGGEGDSGPDIFFCSREEGEIFLQGSISGDVVGFEWVPAAGLSDPFDLNAQVLDLSEPSSYVLMVCNLDGPNLIENGDFADGNIGFTTDYEEGLAAAGRYLVTDSPKNFNSIFDDCDDNSTNDDMMMVIDGDRSPNQNFWCQEVEVAANSTYSFSAWFTNVCSGCTDISPIVSYTVDGVSVNAPELVDAAACTWQKVESDLFVSNGTTIEICIFNLETSSNGNDFAMDDIELYSICKGDGGTCEVLPYQELDLFVFPNVFCDSDTEVQGDLSGSPSNDVTWVWDDGVFPSLNDPSIASVSDPGIYSVTVIDNVTGCETESSFEVLQSDLVTEFTLSAEELSCTNLSTTIFIAGLDLDEVLLILWSDGPNNGNQISDTSFEVTEPGAYTVFVVNDDGCTIEEEITVTRNDEIPEGSIIPPDSLNCISPTTQLTVDAPAGSDYSYDWNSDPTGGNSILVSEPGTYDVVVTDNITGCTTTLTTDVFLDGAAPQYTVDPPSVLDCNNPQVDIGIVGADITFEWQPNSDIISSLNSSSVTVVSPGQYEVLLTNIVNGCTQLETIDVSGDFSEPDVDAGAPLTFGCLDNSLDLAGSSQGNIVSVEWQTSGGIILSGDDTFNPSIGGAGTYTLTVTGENGCTNSAFVIVDADNALPTISAPQSIELNCLIPTAQIDATGSSFGADFFIEWRDANGNIISDFNSLDPTVSEGGQYQLTIINTQNGCDATTVVNVIENFDEPVASTTPVRDLNCINLSSTFGAELDNPDWSFIWADANGPITGENQFQLEASEPGEYTLSIVDQTNGCSNTYMFTLNSIATDPQATITGLSELSCLQSEIEITTTTDANNPSFEWSTADGNILSADNLASIEINAPGTYSVIVVDAITGCTVQEDFIISESADAPMIEIADPAQITCTNNEVSLTGTVTNVGQDVTYVWDTDNGTLSGPNGASNISVSSEGTYTLTIINNENGCSSTSAILVEESISTFLVEIEDAEELNCDITELTLSGMVNAGTGLIFTWSTDNGNIVSDEETLNPTINQSGDYTLTVTDPSNGCESMASITVQQDGNVPELTIATPDELNCGIGQITLNAAGSSEGLDFLIEWSSINGNIVSGENTLTPNVNAPGTYTLSITNVTNNCQETRDIDVIDDSLAPDIELLPFSAIDCENTSVSVSANVNGGSDLSFVWTSVDGFSMTTTEPNLELTDAGDYLLQVIDLGNGCSSSTPFTIEGNDELPDVSLLPPNNIDCVNSSTIVALDLGANSQNFTYTWSTANGTISGPADGTEILATSGGLYEVIVRDLVSSCEVTLSTQVEATAAVPDLDFISPDIITCANPSAVINTQTTVNGLIYEWNTGDGTFMSATNGEDVVVTAAGTYLLVVTNPANNCTNTISVEVEADIELPTVSIADADDLNCVLMEQTLSADGSSTGPEFSYQWTSDLGQILSGENTLTPIINAPGFYTLEIVNTESECKQVDSIFVSENSVQPLASLGTPLDLDCNNEVVDLSSDLTNTDNLILQWTTTNGNIISDPAATIIQVDMPGDYILEIVDQTNGCDIILTTTVDQNADLPSLELSEGFTLNCDLTEGTLSIIESDPAAQITWLDPQMNVLSSDTDIILSEPGIYTAVALFPTTGCETTRTVEILRNENVPTDIIAEITTPLCFGDVGSITLQEVVGGEGPFLFSTDGGESFGDLSILENLEAGSVTQIIAQDANGCLLPDEFVMPNLFDLEASLPPLVELNLGENFQIQVQTNIPTTDIETIVWTPATGLSCTDCLDPSVNPVNSINYEVQITTLNGCVEFAEIEFRVDRNVQVYIPNAFTPFNDDGINDSFYVFANDNLVANVQSLQIYDRWGTQLFINEDFNPNDASAGWGGEYRSERMQSGVYVYFAVVEYFDGTTELFKGDFTLLD